MSSYKDLMKARIAMDLLAAPGSSCVTAKDLAHDNGIAEKSDTCPVTRSLIKDMIDEGMLIGSTSKGYKLMTTGKEVQQCLNSLLKRTIGINKRIQSIYDAAQSKGIL
ncbi:MAG: hypothetical protein JRE23_03225 [Deltaproteobacteria bacterium]|nr:hypothetical protein [Deltaproteobacteria bacterium]